MNWTKTAEQIKFDEGYRSKIYEDTEGVPTIGYGRNLRVGISKDEAEYLFANDLRAAYASCVKRICVFPYLDDDRQGVLVNMRYNLGWPSLSTFRKFLAAMDKQEFTEAQLHMLDSRWATQVGPRAQRLAGVIGGD